MCGMSSVAGSELINRVVSHPSEPVSITAHENRTIRFLDNKTGINGSFFGLVICYFFEDPIYPMGHA